MKKTSTRSITKKTEVMNYKHSIQLDKASDRSIIVHGRKLNCRWLGNHILIWSDENGDSLPYIIIKF